jgi:chromosome segregation ATPase
MNQNNLINTNINHSHYFIDTHFPQENGSLVTNQKVKEISSQQMNRGYFTDSYRHVENQNPLAEHKVIEMLNPQPNALNSQIQNFKEQLEKKDKNINSLIDEIQAKNQTITLLRENLKQKDDGINSLVDEINSLKNLLKSKDSLISSLMINANNK